MNINKYKYYMELAKLTGELSKDPITKVGSVLEKSGRVLSIGYNGAPRQYPDNLIPFSKSEGNMLKDKKNTYMIHSELNAILNYGGSLRDLEGSTLFVTVFPCEECAKAIAQLRIKQVVYLNEYRKKEHMEMSKHILSMCNIPVFSYEEGLKHDIED